MLKSLQLPVWLPEAWYNKGMIHRLANPSKEFASIVISMSVYVCLCLRQDIPGTTRLISTKFLWMLPMDVDRSFSGRVTKSQKEGALFRVFFPIDNSLYSIAFGTYIKTAEQIQMPFGMMSGPRNSVLHGVTIPEGEGAIWGKACARQA